MSRQLDPSDASLERFEDDLRRRAGQPPRRSPREAAAAVRARIVADRPAVPRGLPAWGWGLAATGALAVVWLLAGVPTRYASAPAGSGAGSAPTPAGEVAAGPTMPGATTTLADGQVLIWLDERTPLYMTFAPPPGGARLGGGS